MEKVLIVLLGLLICLYLRASYIEVRAEENYCVRYLIEQDKIYQGCDKYFKSDEWYKEFMKDIDKKYQKLR